MTSPEPSAAVVLGAVARVLGLDAAGLRADTPLTGLGWDSLARLCWADAMREAGYRTDPAAMHRASCVGDLAQCAVASREGS